MKKELKRQIKEDEFASGMSQAWTWLAAHQDRLRMGAVVAIVALAAGLGFSWLRANRAREGQAAFAEALATFHAQVTAAQPAGAPPQAGATFPTAQAKYTKALEQFNGVASRWGSLPVGPRARYYAALSQLQLGQAAPARDALTQLAGSRDRTLAAQAQLGLAQAQAQAGQADEAVATLRRLIDDPQTAVPRDYVLMTLAATLEDVHRDSEAGTAWERLAQEFPDSVFAGEARRRAGYLKNTAS